MQLTQVEDVEFWRNPEKQGWMHSQGEVIKSWRRRWFVLKQVMLFASHLAACRKGLRAQYRKGEGSAKQVTGRFCGTGSSQ